MVTLPRRIKRPTRGTRLAFRAGMMLRRWAFLVSFLVPVVAQAQAPAQTVAPDHSPPTGPLADSAKPAGASAPVAAMTPAPIPADLDHTRHGYGWQTLIADGASLAVGVTGAYLSYGYPTTITTAMFYSGAVGYAVAPPMIHWGHGRIAQGFESLGLRLALPTGGALLGAAIGPPCVIHDDHHDRSCLVTIVGGLLIGLITASVIDSSYLTYETVEPAAGARVASATFSVAPIVTRDHQGMVLQGAF